MKILVLNHTAWMEMMCQSWQNMPEIEIVTLNLPVHSPDKTQEIARNLNRICKQHKIDAILSVNGNAIIYEKEAKLWTPELTDALWIEWWWDDPRHYYHHKSAPLKEAWKELLFSNRMIHAIWDKQLADEYSLWAKQAWHYVPTATHQAISIHKQRNIHK